MSTTVASRREVVASLALGAGALTAVVAPSTAAADQHEFIPVQGDLSHVRRRLAERRRQRLRGEERLSRRGLHNSLGDLRDKDDAITEQDRDFWDNLIDQAFDFFGLDEFSSWFESTYDSIADSLSDVGRGMSDYVRGVFEWVRSLDWNANQIRQSILESLDFIIAAAALAPLVGAPAATLVFVVGVGALLLPEFLGE